MKIQIICTSPGMRRNGIAHPASAFYEPGRWTETELDAFRSDPSFVVREADGTVESTLTEADFALKVDAEVNRLLTIKVGELQATFSQAVQNAVDEKTAELKAAHDNAMDASGKRLDAANQKITDLEQQLAEAKKPAAKQGK